jgi:hypothetical protein
LQDVRESQKNPARNYVLGFIVSEGNDEEATSKISTCIYPHRR